MEGRGRRLKNRPSVTLGKWLSINCLSKPRMRRNETKHMQPIYICLVQDKKINHSKYWSRKVKLCMARGDYELLLDCKHYLALYENKHWAARLINKIEEW